MGKAKEHLSDLQRRELALDIIPKAKAKDGDKEIIGLCPFHQEKNPSFGYNHKKDLFFCHSCRASGDIIDLWAHIEGIQDKKEAYKAFCRKFGIELDQPSDPYDPKTEAYAKLEDLFDRYPPLSMNFIKELQVKKGWVSAAVEKLDLRLKTHHMTRTGEIKPVKESRTVAIPIRTPGGKLRNIRYYTPGAQKNKIISATKIGEVGFGASRIYPPVPAKRDPILLCEGESDTITAISMGFNAVTQTVKLMKWPDWQLDIFRGRDVVIAYDADQPGLKFANAAANNLVKVAARIRVIHWPDFMKDENGVYPEKHGEDLGDYFVKYGKCADDLNELIAATPEYQPTLQTGPPNASAGSSPEPTDADLLEFFETGVNGRLSFKPRILAQRLLSGDQFLSHPETGLFYRWNGKHWELFEDDHLRRRAIHLLGNEAQKTRVEDAVYQAKMISTCPPGRSLDDRHEWICCQNGMFHLMECQLKAHDPDYLATHILGIDADPDQAIPCTRWKQFLEETVQTPAVINQVQEFFGYCLIRDVRFAKAMFLIGPGSDGKSTMIHILRCLVGADNTASVSFEDLEDQFHRASLFGKMLNISSEISTAALQSSFFKAIVTGDPISASYKHKTPFSFKPYAKLITSSNNIPRVLDTTDGFYRRILPIRFKRQFFEGENADPWLEGKLEKELSGIFQWAVMGLHRLLKQGTFTRSTETDRLLLEFRRSNNPVLAFLQDCCEMKEYAETEKTMLYNSYLKYCREDGYRPLSKGNFFRELMASQSSLRQIHKRYTKEEAAAIGKERARVIQGIDLRISAQDLK